MVLVRKLEEGYRGPWVKVRFFKNLPVSYEGYIKDLIFWEAVREANSAPSIILCFS